MHFVLVNACTSLNLFLGLLALYLATLGEITLAASCLLFSVVFDACDGFLARRWGVSSDFGAQLDSLGDFCSFCIASGALAFYWFKPEVPLYLMGIASSLYVIMGAIRLARYNSNTDPICPPAFFEGMPTTASSAILAMLCIAFPGLNCWVGAVLTVILGALMVCQWPYPKLTKMTWLPLWIWAVPIICCAVFFSQTIVVCCGLYLLSGPAVYLKRKLKPAEIAK